MLGFLGTNTKENCYIENFFSGNQLKTRLAGRTIALAILRSGNQFLGDRYNNRNFFVLGFYAATRLRCRFNNRGMSLSYEGNIEGVGRNLTT